jgi:hypothetical protein
MTVTELPDDQAAVPDFIIDEVLAKLLPLVE